MKSALERQWKQSIAKLDPFYNGEEPDINIITTQATREFRDSSEDSGENDDSKVVSVGASSPNIEDLDA